MCFGASEKCYIGAVSYGGCGLEVILSLEFMNAVSVKDLASGEMRGVEVGGKEILLVNIDGAFLAIGNRCTHMNCLLSDGNLRGENVTCACHASVFDVRTGNVVKGPARKPEQAYRTRIEGEQVQIEV